MRQRCLSIAAVCIVSMLWSLQAQAGAWTQPKGQCYAKIWTMALVGSAAFDTEPGTFDTDNFTDVSLNHYAECGLSDNWTVIGTGRFLGWAKYDGLSTLYSGRSSIALRRAILTGPFRVAVEGEYGYQGAVGAEDLARDSNVAFTYEPTVESHTARAGVSVGYGTSWGWLTADTGLRVFSNDDLYTSLVGTFQVGYRITQTLLIDLHLPYNIAFGDLDVNNISGSGNTNYVGLGLGLSWWVTQHVGLSLGFDGVVFAQANASTPAIQLGVEWK